MKGISHTGMALLLLLLTGCGLGTEVGNGAKPKDDDDDGEPKTKAADEESVDSAANTAAPAANDKEGEGDGDADTQGGATDGLEASTDVPEGYDINPSLLFANCASPFSEDFASNYLLQSADTGEGVRNVLHASRTGTGPWQIKDNLDALIYSVEKHAAGGALAVKTKDGADQNVDFGYTCTSVQSKTNVEIDGVTAKVTEKSVYIGNGALKAKVSWYFTPAAAPAKAELVRIEVDDVDGETDPVRLDATVEAAVD